MVSELDPMALDALKNRQRQLDSDGCEVGVSRQALDELIAAYEADASPSQVAAANPAQVTGNMKRDFAKWLEAQPGTVSMYQAYRAGREATTPANPAQVTEAMVEAAQKVLERRVYDEGGVIGEEVTGMVREMLTAAIGAGGQAVAEPAAWLWFDDDGLEHFALGADAPLDGVECKPLYTHPAPSGQAVADTWFTDRALPVKAMSGDVEDNCVLRLHFRRPVTDDDRKSMCDALNLHQASLSQPQPLPLKDEVERVVEPEGEPVTLAACPIGLFEADSGELCLKTEYGSNEGRIDAYIVSSGEFFWGGTVRPADQREVIVQPVAVRAALSEQKEERE